MTRFYVETIPLDGEPGQQQLSRPYSDLIEAKYEAEDRLGRPIAVGQPDFSPSLSDGCLAPKGSTGVGGWHRSETRWSGSVIIWRRDTP